MKKSVFFFLLIAFIVLSLDVEVFAQGCSMCKAQVANPNGDGYEMSKGLNKGIIFLMTVPYLMAGIIGFLWFQKSKKQKEEKEKIEQRVKEALGSK